MRCWSLFSVGSALSDLNTETVTELKLRCRFGSRQAVTVSDLCHYVLSVVLERADSGLELPPRPQRIQVQCDALFHDSLILNFNLS